MKRIKNLLMLVMVFAVALVSVNVNATCPGSIDTTTNTDAAKITITRKVEDVSSAVTNTFGYTVTADSSNPGTVTGAPTTASIAFSSVSPTSNVATATTQLDFTGVTFSKLGTYKFKVEETSSTNSTLYPVDSSNYYTVIVEVRNTVDTTDSKTITSDCGSVTLLQTAYKNNAGTDDTTKSAIEFSSAVKTHFTISKTVTGNMGDRDEYFKFKVTVSTAGAYTIDCTTTSGITYDGNSVTQPTAYDTTGDTYVYLKHGESCTVGLSASSDEEIPASYTWEVVEQDATDYTTYVNSGSTATKTKASAALDTTPSNNVAAFENNQESSTLTGLFLNIWPFILLVVIGGSGLYAIKKTSKEA